MEGSCARVQQGSAHAEWTPVGRPVGTSHADRTARPSVAQVGAWLGGAGHGARTDGTLGDRRRALVLPQMVLQAGRVAEHLSQ